MKAQPFVDLLDCNEAELRKLINLARAVKARPEDYATSLHGKTLYGLYQKTSTRTHVSFSQAAALLGCHYINQSWTESNFPLSDLSVEARYIGTVADFFMARLHRHEDLRQVAEATGIPVINGCCEKFHPMQALADSLTLLEHLGGLGGQRFLYIGVANNMLNSLATTLIKFGVKVVAFTPEMNAASRDERVRSIMGKSGLVETVEEMTPARLQHEVGLADVVYVDTWVDMENFLAPEMAENNRRRTERLRQFSLTPEVYGKSRAAIMHCMPIHPGFEIDRSLVTHPNAIIFPQARNRTYAQAAVLLQAEALCALNEP